MKKEWMALIVILGLLLTSVPAMAQHSYCYYDPHTMVGFGCSRPDFLMLEAKTEMQIAASLGDLEVFWNAAYRAAAVHRQYGGERLVSPDQVHEVLHVDQWKPLQHYQVLDSAEVGTNVRYATVPGASGRPGLIFWDRQGRPMKIAGMSHTSTSGHWFKQVVSWSVGFVLGGGWISGGAIKIATLGKVVVPATVGAAGDGLITLGVAEFAGIPNAGDTHILVDILGNPDVNGHQHVYRNLLVVDKDGKILLKTMDNGTYWQDIGIVSYDRNSNPVW